MKHPLYLIFRPDQQIWQAAVRYGPVVQRVQRRQAIRCAVEAWLKDSGLHAGSLAVNIALKTEIEIRQLEYLKAFELLHDGAA